MGDLRNILDRSIKHGLVHLRGLRKPAQLTNELNGCGSAIPVRSRGLEIKSVLMFLHICHLLSLDLGDLGSSGQGMTRPVSSRGLSLERDLSQPTGLMMSHVFSLQRAAAENPLLVPPYDGVSGSRPELPTRRRVPRFVPLGLGEPLRNRFVGRLDVDACGQDLPRRCRRSTGRLSGYKTYEDRSHQASSHRGSPDQSGLPTF